MRWGTCKKKNASPQNQDGDLLEFRAPLESISSSNKTISEIILINTQISTIETQITQLETIEEIAPLLLEKKTLFTQKKPL